MTQQAQDVPAVVIPALTIVDGRPVTTSLNVAKVFDKQHHHVVQAIDALEVPEEFRTANFRGASYEVKQTNGGKATYPMVQMTRDGFTILVMGFTGKEAMKFKLAYLETFNAMEKKLMATKQTPTPQALPGLAIDSIATFQFDNFKIRVVNKDGEPWFVAADVAKALGYHDATHVVFTAGDEGKKGMHNIHTDQGKPGRIIIDEAGLYSAAHQSRHPGAKKFRQWIMSELMPAVRRASVPATVKVPAPASTPSRLPDTYIRSSASTTDPGAMLTLHECLFAHSRLYIRTDGQGKLSSLMVLDKNAILVDTNHLEDVFTDPRLIDRSKLPLIMAVVAGRLAGCV